MTEKPLIIIGAGGHAKVLIDTLLLQGVSVLGIVDIDEKKIGTSILNLRVLGNDQYLEHYNAKDIKLVNGVGSTQSMYMRKMVYLKYKRAGYCFKSIIHPSAIVATSVQFGEGVQIMAGAVLQADCYVGDNSIINTCASIDHDCNIGEHVHIAPGCVLSGSIQIGANTHIGAGCTIIQGRKIGSNVLAGAGSLLIHDVEKNGKVVGVPARKLEK